MISFRLFIVLIVSVLTGFLSGCRSAQWEKRGPALNSEYDIFDTSSVTGTGLKLDIYNYQPRKCIKSFESSTSGGLLSLEFVNPSAVLAGEKGPYNDFIRMALKRADEYNITGMKPFSVVCVISVTGRMNYLKDNSIQLTEIAENFLDKNDLEGFYRHCGTEFIDNTSFDSSFTFVVTYYMPPEKADYFSGRIRFGKGAGTADINNFSVFSEAGNRYPAFFSAGGSSDSLFIPVEFPIASTSGDTGDSFIKKIIRSCLTSSSGRITSVHLKKWSELPDIIRSMPEREQGMFPEEAHNRIEAITRDMRDFSVFRMKLGLENTKKNIEIIDALAGKINWSNYYKCSWGISTNAYINPEQEKDCRDLIQGLKEFRGIENNNSLISILQENVELNSDIFRELRLVDSSTVSGSDRQNESEYRFNDKTLYADIPDRINPGETMDAKGKLYSSDCIMKNSVTLIPVNSGGLSSISNVCYPVGSRDWGFVKRKLLFWKQPPYNKPLYRGNLEVTSFSESLSESFTITDEAAELARKDLIKFFKKYGTHYVSQVRGRRGIVYYFSTGSEQDKDIRIDSYGISFSYLDEGNVPIPADFGSGCISSLAGKMLNQKKEEPLLHPDTVSEFFRTKENFDRVLRGGTESVPVEIYLKPWSQYLVERGIIRIDQTIPARLLKHYKSSKLEGKVSVSNDNGDSYEGMMSNGLKNGYGELKTHDGSLYKGGWMGDLKHGRGIYKDAAGNVYTGDFMYGYLHGSGEKKDVNGNVYTGSFKKGVICGQGEMIYRDGRKFRGNFFEGEPDGYGVMLYPDGRKEEGNFKKGSYLKKTIKTD